MFDVAHTLDFYCGYLGFGKDWEHRFEPGFPLYVQVSRSEATIHLSEHYGDGSPNTVLWIPVDDVDALHADLVKRGARVLKAPKDYDYGLRDFDVADLDGNMIFFGMESQKAS